MNNRPLPPDNNAQIDIHTPFTPAERIQQLCETDKDIVSLLTHLSFALRSLAAPPDSKVKRPPNYPLPVPSISSQPGAPANINPEEEEADPVASFQLAQTNFLNTIDRVAKHLDRQIYALEEAGIISLRDKNAQAAAAAAADSQQQIQGAGGDSQSGSQVDQDSGRKKIEASLEPDGLGRYGKLTVGQLNLASSTVERDMELELWRKGLKHFQQSLLDPSDRMQE
ncbi:mediator complex, subunit Med11 [Podospora australis]|uniref:Mediator of RNA polymerase II transcription subunit 11 n=1 Tax=Podospora australis TaxID=1536484 RepID=A0AAN6WZ24_9PEZI|nr:mediator complex, subunit Med11 [Podospora australis]